MYDIVQNKAFPFGDNLHEYKKSAYAKYIGDAIFKISTSFMLSKTIDGIEFNKDQDTKWDLYEYLLIKGCYSWYKWTI